MKFGKKKPSDQGDRLNKQQQLRQKIWKDPSIIEDIFADKEWHSFEGNPSQNIPSNKMAKHINEEINHEKEKQERNERRSYRLRQFTRYAAAAAVLVLLSFNLWRWATQHQDTAAPSFVEQHENSRVAQDSIWISVTNSEQQVQVLTLPDQSTVRLFAQSRVRYTREFSSHSRDIYLDGKAYFSVAKDASRPFSVYAGETKTTALGTSFTIDTRTKSKYTTVELHTGKVVVASRAQIPAFDNIVLNKAGESLSFDTNMRLVAHKQGIPKKPTTLAATPAAEKNKASLLQMDNIPLPEVFAALAAAYDTSIKIGEQNIAKIQYTGSINPQRETIQDVLTVICLINDLRYVTEADGSYTIYHQDENTKEEKIKENL